MAVNAWAACKGEMNARGKRIGRFKKDLSSAKVSSLEDGWVFGLIRF